MKSKPTKLLGILLAWLVFLTCSKDEAKRLDSFSTNTGRIEVYASLDNACSINTKEKEILKKEDNIPPMPQSQTKSLLAGVVPTQQDNKSPFLD